MPRSRSGFTLAELLIALACGAVLFAVAAAIALRQQRVFAELADAAATTGRLREVIATLPIDLRAVSPRAGDIREARDTSLEIRATIASAVVCDSAGASSLILAPALAGAEAYAAYLTPIAAGDTAWLLDVRDSTERWIPRRVTSASSTTAARCATGAPTLSRPPFATLVISLDTVGPARAGTVLRVTRPIRYSLYRSSDGSWQLGVRDWNTTAQRFNSVQPVAGPLLPPSGRGLAFSYADSTGGIVANPADSQTGLALIRIAAHAQSLRPVRVLGARAGGVTQRADSLDAVVLLRNRR